MQLFKKNTNKIKVMALGGLNEIGKNMTVVEYKDEIIVIDAGMSFPEDEMLGVDIVIPDINYLVKNKDKVKGIFITHGHDQQMGALSDIVNDILHTDASKFDNYLKSKMSSEERVQYFEKNNIEII